MTGNKFEIVIVGAGSGASLAHKIIQSPAFDANKHNVTLISPHPFSIFMPATLRLVVTSEGSLEDTALIPLDRIFIKNKTSTSSGGNVIEGKVSRITSDSVQLTDGRSFIYNALIVATGSRWDGPIAFPDSAPALKEHVNQWRSKFASAKSVAIIGGGSVGIELACEVKYFYPQTSVTIIHSGELLLNDAYPDKFRKATTKRVEAFGVKVITGDRLDLPPDDQKSASTSKGISIKADLFVSARGGQPNTELFAAFDPTSLTPSGHVKVFPTLQAKLAPGVTNGTVFVLGDIIDWDEQRMLAKAGAHGDIVTQNVLSVANSQNKNGGAPSLIPYQGYMEGIFITMGPKAGKGYLPKLWGIIFGDFLVSSIKSGGLLVSYGRKFLGY